MVPICAEDDGNGYAETYRAYSARYGSAPRTLKRWVAIGKKNGTPPPLDDPAAMPEWWTSNMKYSCPPEIWAAAGTGKQPAPATPKPQAKIPQPKPAGLTPPPAPVHEQAEFPQMPTSGIGLDAEVSALEVLAATLRVDAHLPGKFKGYLDTVARLVATAGKQRIEAERMKHLLPKDLVESIIHEFHGPIERETRMMYPTMCNIMGVPATTEGESKWNAEIDRLFSRMGEELFAHA